MAVTVKFSLKDLTEWLRSLSPDTRLNMGKSYPKRGEVGCLLSEFAKVVVPNAKSYQAGYTSVFTDLGTVIMEDTSENKDKVVKTSVFTRPTPVSRILDLLEG